MTEKLLTGTLSLNTNKILANNHVFYCRAFLVEMLYITVNTFSDNIVIMCMFEVWGSYKLFLYALNFCSKCIYVYIEGLMED